MENFASGNENQVTSIGIHIQIDGSMRCVRVDMHRASWLKVGFPKAMC